MRLSLLAGLALVLVVFATAAVAEDLRGAAPYRFVAQEGAVDQKTLLPDFVATPSGVTARAERFERLEDGRDGNVSWSVFRERKTGGKFLVCFAFETPVSAGTVAVLRSVAERCGAAVVGCGVPTTGFLLDAQQNSPEWDLRKTNLSLVYDPKTVVPYEFRIDAPRKTPTLTRGAAHIFDFSLRSPDDPAADVWDPYVPTRVSAGEFDAVSTEEIDFSPKAYETPIRTIVEAGKTLFWLRERHPQKPIVLRPLEGAPTAFETVVNAELRKFAILDGVRLADFPPDGEVRGAARTDGVSSTRGPWWWFHRLAQKNRQIARLNGEVDLVMIGDSITHFWEGCAYWTSGREEFRKLQRDYSVLNLGYGGDATQNVLWRLENGELDGYRATAVTLMIGTNDRGSAESVAADVRRILEVIRRKQPAATILLHPILPRGLPQDAMRLRNEKANVLIRTLADGDPVIWCDFNDRFLNRDGTIRDGLMTDERDPKTGRQLLLHPHREGYEVWRQALLPQLDRLVRNGRMRQVKIDDGEVTRVWTTNGETVVDFVLRPTTASFIRNRLWLADPAVWDGRFWGVGNGGWAGQVWDLSAEGSARLSCDLGTSRTTRNDAPENIEVIRDYSWRATHLATVAAKRLVEAYYGRKPKKCYFTGASCGGRQGLMEALRYPDDYDGIVSEVPGFTERSRAGHAWQRERLKRKYGTWFTAEEQRVVRAAELRYFATRDPAFARGKFILDPYPTPEKLDGCWREIVRTNPGLADREALWRELFDPVMVEGRIFVSGKVLGIEFDSVWGFMLPKILGPRTAETTTEAEMAAFGREPDGRVNSDLRAFKAHGGKLIMYGGMEDLSCAEIEMRAYYDSVLLEMGGAESVQDFFLYFSEPGRTHGARGEAAGTGKIGRAVRINEQLVDWVENGRCPDCLTFRWTSEPKVLKVTPYPANVVSCKDDVL